MAQPVDGVAQGLAQHAGAVRVVLQQVVSHALRRLGAHPGQALEGIDQHRQRRRPDESIACHERPA